MANNWKEKEKKVIKYLLMLDNTLEFTEGNLFLGSARIQQARKELRPVNNKVLGMLNKSYLWKEKPYSYEQAAIESWFGLSERKYYGASLNERDLDNVKVIISWIGGLNKEQCLAGKLPNRKIAPLLLSEQTKAELKIRLEQLNKDFINNPEALDQVIMIMRGLCNQLKKDNLLNFSITTLNEEIKK